MARLGRLLVAALVGCSVPFAGLALLVLLPTQPLQSRPPSPDPAPRRVHPPPPAVPLEPPPPPKLPRVAVLVAQTTVDPQRHPARVKAILETWASGPLTVRFLNSPAAPAGMAFNLPVGQPKQRRTEQLVWGLRRALAELDRPDWVVKVDDISFLLPQHLLAYLATLDPTEPLMLGNRLQTRYHAGDKFVSGGAGMVFSRAAVESLLADWETGCGLKVGAQDFLKDSDDVALSGCLQELGLILSNTRTDGGEERFNAFGLVRSATGRVDGWYKDYKDNIGEELHTGLGCCAAQLVSLHYVEPAMARLLHRLFQRDRPAPTGPAELLEMWPNQHELGGYDSKPSGKDEAELVLRLIHKVRSGQ